MQDQLPRFVLGNQFSAKYSFTLNSGSFLDTVVQTPVWTDTMRGVFIISYAPRKDWTHELNKKLHSAREDWSPAKQNISVLQRHWKRPKHFWLIDFVLNLAWWTACASLSFAVSRWIDPLGKKEMTFSRVFLVRLSKYCTWLSYCAFDDDHVDGVRPHLWTAATNGPIVHPPGDIWTWRTVMEWYRQRKTPDSSTRAVW
jgi:hypothetical protein